MTKIKLKKADREAAVESLRQAQDDMRSARDAIDDAMRSLGRNSITSERIRTYIKAHLECLIDSEHDWLDSSQNVEEFIEDIESGEDEDDDEEE